MKQFEFSEGAKITLEKMRGWSVEELLGCKNVAYRNLCDPRNTPAWEEFLYAAIGEFYDAIRFKLNEEEEKLLRRRGEL